LPQAPFAPSQGEQLPPASSFVPALWPSSGGTQKQKKALFAFYIYIEKIAFLAALILLFSSSTNS